MSISAVRGSLPVLIGLAAGMGLGYLVFADKTRKAVEDERPEAKASEEPKIPEKLEVQQPTQEDAKDESASEDDAFYFNACKFQLVYHAIRSWFHAITLIP
jgi:hypothetical protein